MRILVLLFCIGVFAAAGVGKEAAEPSRVLSREDRFEKAELAEARERATEFWFKAQGILAEESIRPERAFKAVRAIEGFAERDDRIWEVRVVYLTGQTTGLLWINARTKRVQALGVPVKP
jgi:hypothetical protein